MASKYEHGKDDESTVGLLPPTAPMTTPAHSHSFASRYRYVLLASSFFLVLTLYHILFGPASTRTRYLISPSQLPIEDDNFLLGSTLALPKHVGSNRGLSYAQCDIGFPLLWPQLMETANKDRSRGVALADLDAAVEHGGTRVAIIDNQLYVKAFNPQWTKRTEAVLASLHEAIVTSPEEMPNVDFWFRSTDDLRTEAVHFGLNRESDQNSWLIPDFGFWSWPEPGVNGWVDYRRKALRVSKSMTWTEKGKRLFWRGALLSDLRKQLRDAVAGKSWSDVSELDWATGEGRVNMEDHCKHRYLLATEGNTAYSGRLKYLLECDSVVVSHRMKYTQHFHGAFDSDPNSPNQNIVELRSGGWEDLESIMLDLSGNDDRSRVIAANAVRTFRGRYLTPASVTCWWRRMLLEYASIQKFRPTIGDGVDYESMSLMNSVKWDPHR